MKNLSFAAYFGRDHIYSLLNFYAQNSYLLEIKCKIKMEENLKRFAYFSSVEGRCDGGEIANQCQSHRHTSHADNLEVLQLTDSKKNETIIFAVWFSLADPMDKKHSNDFSNSKRHIDANRRALRLLRLVFKWKLWI